MKKDNIPSRLIAFSIDTEDTKFVEKLKNLLIKYNSQIAFLASKFKASLSEEVFAEKYSNKTLKERILYLKNRCRFVFKKDIKPIVHETLVLLGNDFGAQNEALFSYLTQGRLVRKDAVGGRKDLASGAHISSKLAPAGVHYSFVKAAVQSTLAHSIILKLRELELSKHDKVVLMMGNPVSQSPGADAIYESKFGVVPQVTIITALKEVLDEAELGVEVVIDAGMMADIYVKAPKGTTLLAMLKGKNLKERTSRYQKNFGREEKPAELVPQDKLNFFDFEKLKYNKKFANIKYHFQDNTRFLLLYYQLHTASQLALSEKKQAVEFYTVGYPENSIKNLMFFISYPMLISENASLCLSNLPVIKGLGKTVQECHLREKILSYVLQKRRDDLVKQGGYNWEKVGYNDYLHFCQHAKFNYANDMSLLREIFLSDKISKQSEFTLLSRKQSIKKIKLLDHISYKNSNLFVKASVVIPGQKHPERNTTELHLAILAGRKDIVEQCIKLKLDVNLINQNGITPLFLALMRFEFDIASLLIKKGADPLMCVSGGLSPYEFVEIMQVSKHANQFKKDFKNIKKSLLSVAFNMGFSKSDLPECGKLKSKARIFKRAEKRCQLLIEDAGLKASALTIVQTDLRKLEGYVNRLIMAHKGKNKKKKNTKSRAVRIIIYYSPRSVHLNALCLMAAYGDHRAHKRMLEAIKKSLKSLEKHLKVLSKPTNFVVFKEIVEEEGSDSESLTSSSKEENELEEWQNNNF